MHEYLIKDISQDKSKYYLIKVLDKLKTEDEQLYLETENDIYCELYGCHFNEYTLNEALSNMVNEDGTSGAHWSLEQTNAVARQHNVDVNLYDWCYVMNMIYSDYYGAVPNELSTYFSISHKFINDKDAPEGKPYKYYLAMKKH